MSQVPSIIFKISWNQQFVDGRIVRDLENVVGGVCGTCFSIEGGRTFTATHVVGEMLFQPNEGYNTSCCFVVHPDGELHQLRAGQVSDFTDTDISEIDVPPSSELFAVRQDQVPARADLEAIGFDSRCEQFTVRSEGDLFVPELTNFPELVHHMRDDCAQSLRLNIRANDVTIVDKPGFRLNGASMVGMSGGPVVNSECGSVVAVACAGLPADEVEKTSILAVALRTVL